MHMLLRIAETYNVAVVATNQIQATPDLYFGDPSKPAGGHVVAHTSTYRVYLRRAGKHRIARMVDSPYHPEREVTFMLSEKGIEDVEEKERKSKSRRKGSTRQEWTVKKEGMLQLAIVGSIEQSIKLFESLTGNTTSIYEVLMRPKVGTFNALNINIQIVLTPMDNIIGEDRLDRFASIARNADAIIVIVESLDYLHSVCKWFEARNLNIISKAKVEIEYTPHGGIRIVGRSDKVKESDVFEFVKGYGIKNAVIKVYSNATLDDVEDAIFGRVSKRAIFVMPNNASNNYTINYNGISIDIIAFNNDKERFMLDLLRSIGLIRVFTKKVGTDAVDEPLLLQSNAKVIELAEMIHKDLAKNLKFARVWRNGVQIKVGKDFILNDLDVVELHA